MAETLLGTDNYELVLCLHHLGNSLARRSKPEAALLVFDEAEATFAEMRMVRSWGITNWAPHSIPAIFHRAEALATIGDYEQAERVFLLGCRIVQETKYRRPEDKRSFITKIPPFYESWEAAAPGTGKARAAEHWRQELMKIK